MDQLPAILTTLGASIAGILTAAAVLTKARGEASAPRQVLRRLWDWLYTKGLREDVPPELAEDVRKQVGNGDDE
ncbi:MAG: hypothetical protein ACRCYU_19095 [Nocardioides sp.]